MASEDFRWVRYGMVFVALGVATYATARNLEGVVLSADTYTLPEKRTRAQSMNRGALPAKDTSAYLRVDMALMADVALPMLAGGVLLAANFSLIYIAAAVLALVLGALNIASGGMATMAAGYGSSAVRAAVATQVGRDEQLPRAMDLASVVTLRIMRPSGPLSQFAKLAYNSYRPWYGFLAHLMVAYACSLVAAAAALYVLHRPRDFDTTTHFRMRGASLYMRRRLALSVASALPWTALALLVCVKWASASSVPP